MSQLITTVQHSRLTYTLTTEELCEKLAWAWQEGYAAGWKDQECDFPQYTSENPYKETVKIEKEGE